MYKLSIKPISSLNWDFDQTFSRDLSKLGLIRSRIGNKYGENVVFISQE